MVKDNSEAEFRKRIRAGDIIDIEGIETKEDLIIRMKRGLSYPQPSPRQISLASEELKLIEPKAIREPVGKFYTYHGRKARFIGRDVREEEITVRGRTVTRKRDVKTGRFV